MEHIVKPGECLSSIAKLYGFYSYKTIYEDTKNNDFREKYPDPNVIFAGEKLFIPEREQKEIPGSTEQEHEFVVKYEKTMLRLCIRDEDDKPFANVSYKLKIDGKRVDPEFGEYFKTNARGIIKHEIRADASIGEIVLFSDKNRDRKLQPAGVVPLALGYLDPIEKRSGVQARLNNLGFDCGRGNSPRNSNTKEAILDFQGENNLAETSEVDDVTRDKLLEKHDWERN